MLRGFHHLLMLLPALACSAPPKAPSVLPAQATGDAAPHAAQDGAADASAADAGTALGSGGEREIDAETSEPSTPTAQTECPRVKAGVERGKLGPDALAEASGLVASRRNAGVLWVHNDSGDSARVFAIDGEGKLVSELAISGADAIDWEDLAIGPGPEAGKSYLYLGDIGDNNKVRKSVQIYRVEEPDLSVAKGPLSADRLEVTYADGPHDAETLLIDPLRGELFIVTKGGDARIFGVGTFATGSASATAQKLATVQLFFADGGDVLPDGTGVAVRSYTTVRYWPRDPQKPLASAFAQAGCSFPLADVGTQGEALGFAADGKGYFTVAEGAHAPLYFYGFE